MKDLGLLVLRFTAGGLLAGHGAQKLFGRFGGDGLDGTAGFLESIGFKPGRPWAILAGLSELGGGALTALGLGGPLGPIATLGSMAMATATVHRGKPIWATEGGAELPVMYMAAATAVALSGPGRYSLDRLLRINKVPRRLSFLALVATAAGIGFGLARQRRSAMADKQRAQKQPKQDTQKRRAA
ncbi:MAG: DoxX family protein [Nitrospirae bacterium]|nr:DoxX family protein [Candidatus Manganitrophaceae bacterium]